MNAALEGVRHNMGEGMAWLPFALAGVTAQKPRCLWCRHEFTPSKPNQLYCRRKHSQYACDRRKAELGMAVAALLQGHGASPQRAQDAAGDVVEAYYASGRVQRAVEAFGGMYDEVSRRWHLPAV